MPYQPSTFFKQFLCLFLILAIPLPTLAGWRIIPIRLDFDQRTRSGVVTLSNDSEEAISFTIDAVEWSQDESGQDLYAPAKDLVFFPKVLYIPAKQERVVRAGIRVPAVSLEKTYRLLIKEAPNTEKADGTTVAIAIQFGVPIFAKPVKEDQKGELSAAISSDGTQIEVTAVNGGNVHFRVKTITLSSKNTEGKEIMHQEIDGWYLLAGSTRTFVAPLPAEFCAKIATIDIQADATPLTLNEKIDIDPDSCAPR